MLNQLWVCSNMELQSLSVNTSIYNKVYQIFKPILDKYYSEVKISFKY